MHFWRSRFAEVYIGFGLFAWFFPTRTPQEIVARVFLVLLGIGFLFSIRNERLAYTLFLISIGFIFLWVGLAIGLIIQDFDDPAYRINFVYLPLWYLLVRLHYRAIEDIKSGR